MVKDLNVRPDTTKCLKENIGRTLFDINYSNFLFDLPPRTRTIKRKINQWDLIKLKGFAQQRKPLKILKNNTQNGRKSLLTMQPTGPNLENVQSSHTAQH